MKKPLLIALCVLGIQALYAQQQNENVWEFPGMKQSYRYQIHIPNLPGYKTLKCDLHIHTMFSDGQVFPEDRVTEAWASGLDVIAITDHIEKQRYSPYLKYDLNTSNNLAVAKGKSLGITVIRGGEITRKKPFGHMNALFVSDVNLLKAETPEEAVEVAVKQGALIQWNHPGWPNDTSTLYPVQKKLLEEKKIQLIEIFNAREAYPLAMDWCNEYHVGYSANSDMHPASGTVYRGKMERPMTLVFAKENSEESIKEAILAGRTMGYFWNHLAGNENLMAAMIKECISVKVLNEKSGSVELVNNSDIEFQVKYGNLDYSYILHPNESLLVVLKKGTVVDFTNCFTGKFKTYKTKLW